MNSLSCQSRNRLFLGVDLSERRDRKKEVDMMSNFHPSFRASASAFGIFGVSI
ncbi:hypothetical protein D3C87_2044780 [compost metagenome]